MQGWGKPPKDNYSHPGISWLWLSRNRVLVLQQSEISCLLMSSASTMAGFGVQAALHIPQTNWLASVLPLEVGRSPHRCILYCSTSEKCTQGQEEITIVNPWQLQHQIVATISSDRITDAVSSPAVTHNGVTLMKLIYQALIATTLRLVETAQTFTRKVDLPPAPALLRPLAHNYAPLNQDYIKEISHLDLCYIKLKKVYHCLQFLSTYINHNN